MAGVVQSVKRALSIQEQRQADYKKLRKLVGVMNTGLSCKHSNLPSPHRSHEDYISQTTTPEEYQKCMAEITASFQVLSQEMIELSKVLHEHPLPQAAEVLDKIQAKEKEKLQLTAQWQVMMTEQRAGEERDQLEDAAHSHRQRGLRQKLVIDCKCRYSIYVAY